MKRVLISALAAAGLVAAPLLSGLTATASADTAPAYTVQTLHFAVNIGPAPQQTCDIVGDVYVPATASRDNKVPAILTTNGFGGSKADQAGFAAYAASHGYAVLSYSGLGFGGSTCKITLDDPAYDGQAGSQLVSYLGGAPGIAFLDAAHTQPAPQLTVVVHDEKAYNGQKYTYDPRVGMIGGSYGGEIQFAVAGIDPRVDTIIPMITWNDLSYSLAPNNANQVGTTVTSPTPGDAKVFWAFGFSAIGVVDGLQGAQQDPSRLIPCPNFADWVCPGLAYAGSTGTLDSGTLAHLQSASVASYMKNIRVPVLLAQGEFDTLFNLNEAVATYQALKAQGTPVSMIWHSWGHSSSTPQPGEFNMNNPDPTTQYETGRVFDWFAKYLKNADVSTGPGFAYYRDWVPYTGNAAPAFGSAAGYGTFANQRYYLGTSDLSTGAANGTGVQSFLTAAGGLPTSMNPIDAIGSMVPIPQQEQDAPGTFASWTSSTLAQNLDVVGSPVLHLTVSAPLSGGLSVLGTPLTNLVLFVRVRDVAPDGTASDIRQLTAPIRVDPNGSFVVRLPAIVHRFAAGHKLQLVVAGGSINYRGGLTGNLVMIAGGSNQTLDLPTP
ncbi:MAG: alpha/beta fold hydrolase [Marmoricola sp.]